MKYISILLPALSVEQNCIIVTTDNKEDMIIEVFNIQNRNFDVIPLSYNQYAIKFKSLSIIKLLGINFQDIESILQQNQNLQVNLQRQRNQFSNLIKQFSNRPSFQQITHTEDSNKRQKKYKELKEDNRKLKKTQLQNAQKMRIDTQKTVETLKHQFDQLVKELLNQKKEKMIKRQPIQLAYQHIQSKKTPISLQDNKGRMMLNNFL